MKDFWTCGPFKECNDRMENMAFRIEQMRIFTELLEEDKSNQNVIENGSAEEKLLASMIQLDIDKKMATLLGVPNGREKKVDEISGETVLEFIDKRPAE